MSNKKRILLKLTGNVFLSENKKESSSDKIREIAKQIKALMATHVFSIVIGGGNFFRGSEHGKQLKITESVGHHVGMLATMMNGLILNDIFQQEKIKTSLFSAIVSPGMIAPTRDDNIKKAITDNKVLIFSGGTGLPFFTTDTNAVIRSLQIDTHEIWKASCVDGVYDSDPKKNPDAKLIKKINYNDIIKKNIKVMDKTAFALAYTYKKTIRVFNIFIKNALINASQDTNFGSTIS